MHFLRDCTKLNHMLASALCNERRLTAWPLCSASRRYRADDDQQNNRGSELSVQHLILIPPAWCGFEGQRTRRQLVGKGTFVSALVPGLGDCGMGAHTVR